MFKRIGLELVRHAPFTAVGAVAGIIVMVIIYFSNAPKEISNSLFYTLHPLHVVLSALVTASMYRMHNTKVKLWATILIGYTGSIGIATLSDIVIPYLGGGILNIPMEFHLPFIEIEKMPYIDVAKWIVINSAAVIGIAIAIWKPNTRFPHMGHVLLSTWASLFSFIAFGIADWIPLLPFIFLFLFLSVWLPCCVSDIVFPLLWVPGESSYEHTHH
ncbi:MAG: hypothetical protein KAW90_05265 [Dehalococcoidales bacterium]|nr:hypothetical protein [Dehalococcoidales bacterium]